MVSSAQGYIWFYERRSQRGQVPADWGEAIPLPVTESKDLEGGLATPESEEKVNADTNLDDKLDQKTWEEGHAGEVNWQGRLRGNSFGRGELLALEIK